MADSTTQVAIVGAGGLTGKELLTLLRHHPRLDVVHITSNQYAGRHLGEVFPELSGAADVAFSRHEAPLPPGAAVFLAVPNETSLEIVPGLLSAGHRVVDLSGAFRLHDRARFEKYYGLKHEAFELMDRVAYGMPELFRSDIRGRDFVSNPGCFPTGSTIPLHLLRSMHADISDVVIDAKSGVSGAGGRVEGGGFAFTAVSENFRAYKILKHQHQPEIEEYAGPDAAGFPIVFTPHLLPLYRGILNTLVIRWKKSPDAQLVLETVRRAAADEPFVRVYDEPEAVELRHVQHTNRVDLGLRTEGPYTVLVSAIDNLVKGAAGQAIQNLNLMLGFEERMGLGERPTGE